MAPREQEPGSQSKRGWQHAEVAVPGPAGELRAGRQPRCPGVAGNLLRSSPAPDLWTQSPCGRCGRAPGGTGATHMAAPRGWASRMWVLVDTLLLSRGAPGPSPRPLPNLLRHRPAGPGAGCPRHPCPLLLALCPGEGRPRRAEFCTGGVGRDTVLGPGLPGRLDKQSQGHPPGGWAMIARRSPEAFQVTRHRALRAGTRIPGREGTAHSLLPGPAPAAEATLQVPALWGPSGRGLCPPTAPGDGQGPGQALTAGRGSSMEGREAAPGTPERRALSDPRREARLQEGPAPSMGVGGP